MTTLPPCYGIIPARYKSHRFPGKPLADILGKPMFYHVYERASSCPLLQKVWLATDDQRIYDAAEKLAVPVVMTNPDHPSGSDRIMEAANILGLEDSSVIVNIQGDEPALDPEMLRRLVEPFTEPHLQVTTLARIIDAEAKVIGKDDIDAYACFKKAQLFKFFDLFEGAGWQAGEGF